MLSFAVTSRDDAGRARRGTLELRRGTVETPVFAPVATRATVKGIVPEQLRGCGTQMLLANTYHLELTPGAETIEQLGGLHHFMAWDRPILTDSGGYQVFSLADLRDITEEGVEFKSPRDGSTMFLGPREAVQIQEQLGSDIAMVFDECPPYPSSREDVSKAVERTLRWAQTSREVHDRPDQALFGIVQGGIYEELRQDCARRLTAMEFDGYAIGGVSVGEEEELRRQAVDFTIPLLPEDKPRYLMGVGFPEDLLEAVGQGIDMFDCVAPTRMGRNATAFTRDGRVRIRNSAHTHSNEPLEDGCECPTCRLYSRGYINHLFRCREMLGPILLSLHNVHFYHRLMEGAREAIQAGDFTHFKDEFLCRYNRETNR